MALTHLIDTSVLKRLRAPSVRKRVETLAATGGLGRPTICDLEVGYSARTAAEWDRIVGALDVFDRVAISDVHLKRALQVQRLLAARSQRGSKVSDLLIAAAAEQLGVAVLHYDTDFDHIAKATGQNCEWVVRRGTVD